ncbi:MAG TPA: hypothetical protein VF021_09010 [Longimicrobiales bacterium]
MAQERQGQGNPQQGGERNKSVEQAPRQGEESTREGQPRQGDRNTETTRPDVEREQDTETQRPDESTSGTE